jgi:hypothetical protein
MRVAPAEGLVIRDPVTKQFVPPEGIDVPDGDLFWQRRLRDRDAVKLKPQSQAESAAPAAPEATERRSAE